MIGRQKIEYIVNLMMFFEGSISLKELKAMPTPELYELGLIAEGISKKMKNEMRE